ncbi:Protein CBG21692 [Caenorhabditis briggsae]|uniref:Protein CBG21692 n=1 Tax=Caenorhabditis briggsae TaxID=6238 RepID=A8Y0Q5_CAEBR|nr:Protein CBG21692 [Caenorhabditis briggsae]CAP38475.2 Protein CBG21692 [Caenorhabditis briggsae]
MYFVLFLNILHSNWSPNILYTVFVSTIALYLFFCKFLAVVANSREHARTIVTLFLFAYAFTPVIRVSYPTSVSSGLSSAIFLLSRLEEDTPTLLLLVIAFTLHAYGAEFRNRMFHVYPVASSLIFTVLSLFSVYCISSFSVELSVFWALLHVFILFVCPLILILKQTGKCTIHGPWDEAVPIKSMN